MSTSKHILGRESWPEGPWTTEPDELFWVHRASGYPCWILRHHRIGFLRGYVCIPKGHPLHSKDIEIAETVVFPHGGITFAASGLEMSIAAHQENLVNKLKLRLLPGGWWFGFDCAHASDVVPGWLNNLKLSRDVYKDIKFVRGECNKLARSLKLLADERVYAYIRGEVSE